MIVLTGCLSYQVEALQLGSSADGHNEVKCIMSAHGSKMGFEDLCALPGI
jgi:hypothetical protein